MGNGALAIGPKLPRPSSTLPEPTSSGSRGGTILLVVAAIMKAREEPSLHVLSKFSTVRYGPIRAEAGWPGTWKRLPVSVTPVPSTLRIEKSWLR